jgi:hypothetical protein
VAVSDEELMLAYAAAAFGALYGQRPLYRFLLRSVKASSEAEEPFQDI